MTVKAKTVMLDQISSVKMASLGLPIPEDKRLKKIYDLLSVPPSDHRRLEEWGQSVGATGRTLSRHLRRETGMGFGQ